MVNAFYAVNELKEQFYQAQICYIQFPLNLIQNWAFQQFFCAVPYSYSYSSQLNLIVICDRIALFFIKQNYGYFFHSQHQSGNIHLLFALIDLFSQNNLDSQIQIYFTLKYICILKGWQQMLRIYFLTILLKRDYQFPLTSYQKPVISVSYYLSQNEMIEFWSLQLFSISEEGNLFSNTCYQQKKLQSYNYIQNYQIMDQSQPGQNPNHQQIPNTIQPIQQQIQNQPERIRDDLLSSSSSDSFKDKRQNRRVDDFDSDSNSPLNKANSSEKENSIKDMGQKNQNKKIRYKYCCKVCKHTDSNKKACVCVVPLGQRRTQIGSQGCQTCGCTGCSKQDFISRGQDPQYHPGEKKYIKKQKQRPEFEARNGCCRNCMKAFSKTNKSCLCQVPQNVRNTKLPSSGCKICGCFGCNPEDKKQKQAKAAKKSRRQRSRSRDKRKKRKRSRSSSSSNSREYIDSMAMNFNNVDRSVIGGMIVNEYRIDPALLGFGIPQRTYSYLTGKPK